MSIAFSIFFVFPFQKVDEKEKEGSVFKDGIGEWDNSMADGMMPLEQEEAAFGDVMALGPGDNGNYCH